MHNHKRNPLGGGGGRWELVNTLLYKNVVPMLVFQLSKLAVLPQCCRECHCLHQWYLVFTFYYVLKKKNLRIGRSVNILVSVWGKTTYERSLAGI